MSELTTLQRAQILDANNAPLVGAAYSATSSNTGVAALGDFGNGTLQVASVGVGESTITVTRHADGSSATLDVTVVADANVLAIHLGTPVPK